MGRQSHAKQQRREATAVRDRAKYELASTLLEDLKDVATFLEVTADTADRGALTPERAHRLRELVSGRLRPNIAQADALLATWRAVSHAEAEQT